MFASTKGKQQKYFRQLQCQEQFIDHIPYYISGLLRAHVFRQPNFFSDNFNNSSDVMMASIIIKEGTESIRHLRSPVLN